MSSREWTRQRAILIVSFFKTGKPPNIQFTENTTSRISYVELCRFPHLLKINPHSRKTRYGYTPEACRKPVKGIGELFKKIVAHHIKIVFITQRKKKMKRKQKTKKVFRIIILSTFIKHTKKSPQNLNPVCPFLGHLSHSDDLLLLVGVRRRPSSVVR